MKYLKSILLSITLLSFNTLNAQQNQRSTQTVVEKNSSNFLIEHPVKQSLNLISPDFAIDTSSGVVASSQQPDMEICSGSLLSSIADYSNDESAVHSVNLDQHTSSICLHFENYGALFGFSHWSTDKVLAFASNPYEYNFTGSLILSAVDYTPHSNEPEIWYGGRSVGIHQLCFVNSSAVDLTIDWSLLKNISNNYELSDGPEPSDWPNVYIQVSEHPAAGGIIELQKSYMINEVVSVPGMDDFHTSYEGEFTYTFPPATPGSTYVLTIAGVMDTAAHGNPSVLNSPADLGISFSADVKFE